METMVVSASKGVMNSLLTKLTTLMGDEFKNLKGVRKQVSFLKNELSTINTFLETLELIDELDPLTKEWRSHVREMAYDIEDCIDYFMHHLGETDPKEGFINKTARRLKNIRHRHHIAHQIGELKARVLEASERRARYRLDELVPIAGSVAIDPRVTALYTEAANLVGIDGPREELIKWLTDTQQQLKVVSIVGFGGLGKTTLAKEVYHNIGEQFECKSFVSVSQRSDMTRLLNGILSNLKESSPTNQLHDIIDSIRKCLEYRRYIIVVDDLWDKKDWDIIRCAFPENGNGSRVIVTTRVEDVASRACGHHLECIYRMKPLNRQDSRRLFFNRIFGCEDGCPSQFEEIAAKVLKKCGGLPLAIITIASLLASQQPRLWKQCECILNSLSMHNDTNPTLEGVRQILDLSYKNLPPRLRTCLLYLGVYPEDSEIKRDALCRQWVAEGFVGNFHGQDSDDVAKSYFNELINRSLILPESNDCGEVLSCRVHDMILDLILHRCEEDNFITLVRSSEDMAGQHDKVRRLSMNLNNDDVGIDYDDSGTFATSLSQVRSLAMFGKSNCIPPLLLFKNLRGKSNCIPPLLLFKNLRVLIIDSWRTDKVDLTDISHLCQLKYLKVVQNYSIIVLPTFQGLRHLETLEIFGYLAILSDIIYLPLLSHLIVPKMTSLPDGLDNLKRLRTLAGFKLKGPNIRCLGELGELMKLELSGDWLTLANDTRGLDAFVSSLRKLRKLRHLQVQSVGSLIYDKGERLGSLTDPPLHLEQLLLPGWSFSRVPSWISGHLKNLWRLSLHVQRTSTEEVRVLGGLPSLVHLMLTVSDNSIHRPAIIFSAGSFPALEHLYFRYGADATRYMRFEAPGVLPNIRRLTLGLDICDLNTTTATDFVNTTTVVGLEYLTSLEDICVEKLQCHSGPEFVDQEFD